MENPIKMDDLGVPPFSLINEFLAHLVGGVPHLRINKSICKVSLCCKLRKKLLRLQVEIKDSVVEMMQTTIHGTDIFTYIWLFLMVKYGKCWYTILGGGLKYFLCSPLLGEMI